MQHMDLEQAADYLEAATIDNTTDTGHAITHRGISAAGARFVLVNDFNGRTVLFEAT